MSERRRIGWPWVVLLLVLALSMGLGGGLFFDRLVLFRFIPPSNIPAEATSGFKLMAEVWNVIGLRYVDREALQPLRLTYGAISGMVDALGDTGHSRFMTPAMVQAEQNAMKGEFEGIGAEVQMKGEQVVIVAPLDDSPAQKAGLRPGDIIFKVNGEDLTGLSIGQVIERVMGPAGTSVTLTIVSGVSAEGGDGVAREVVIVRGRITLQNVTWQVIPGTAIAHLRLAAFSQGVTANLGKALEEIRKGQIKGVILDLRSNSGGLLDEAVSTTSQFLSAGDVLQVKDAQGTITPLAVQLGGVATDIPLVVLINRGTASAAEIMAGALQDAGRAKLVGETTFGTGTVLNTFSLPDGSALLLATQEWLTPSGRVIWHRGIAPDIEVSLPAGIVPLRPRAEQDMTPEQISASGDEPLLRALKLLNP